MYNLNEENVKCHINMKQNRNALTLMQTKLKYTSSKPLGSLNDREQELERRDLFALLGFAGGTDAEFDFNFNFGLL